MIEEKDGDVISRSRRSTVPPRDDDGRPTTWENDAVQLCGQALLMEEAFGATVRTRLSVLCRHPGAGRGAVSPTDCGRQRRTAIDQCRQLSAQDAPPDPLPPELRHRCFGCSLAPVCLPEETLYQIGLPPTVEESATPAVGMTRVIPQSDDGAVLYVQEAGSHVGKRSEHLVVRRDGQEVTRVPMHAVRQVVVCSNVQVSTQALETLAANEIPVAYVTGHGRFIGALPAEKKNVGLRKAQFRRFADTGECLMLAKAVVRGKLMNQRALLMRSLRGDGDRGSDEPAARGMADLFRPLDCGRVSGNSAGPGGPGRALVFRRVRPVLTRSSRLAVVSSSRRATAGRRATL